MEENRNLVISSNQKGNTAHLPAGSPDGTGGQFASQDEKGGVSNTEISVPKQEKKPEQKDEQKTIAESEKEEILSRQGEEFSTRESTIKEFVRTKKPFEEWALNENGSLNQNGRTFVDMYFYTPFFKENYLPKILDRYKNILDEETPYVEIINDGDDLGGSDFVLFKKDGTKICIDLKTSRYETTRKDFSKLKKEEIEAALEKEKDEWKQKMSFFDLPVIREYGKKHHPATVFKSNETNMFFKLNIMLDSKNNIPASEMYEMLINDTSENNKDFYDIIFSQVLSSRAKSIFKKNIFKDLTKAGITYEKIEEFYKDAKSIFYSGLNSIHLFNVENKTNYMVEGRKIFKNFYENGKIFTFYAFKKGDGKIEVAFSEQ